MNTPRRTPGGTAAGSAAARIRARFRGSDTAAAVVLGAVVSCGTAVRAATVQDRYYGHEAVHDAHGVIAPWYRGLNGPCDLRVRVAAETLKRYPWAEPPLAVTSAPHYVFNGHWAIRPDGTIVVDPRLPDWDNGDLGQRATSVLNGFVDYYRYTGDPAAVAHVTYMADYLLDHCVTAKDHPWPGLFVSVPTRGKVYQKADPRGMIQLDLVGSTGEGLLRAYQLAGNPRWLAAARRWADVLAARCALDPDADPWPRYANPEDVKWGRNTLGNRQTVGVVMIVRFLDEVIRLGHTGRDRAVVAARDAGRRHLRDRLLPAWWANDTWGRYFWDWEGPVQECLITSEAARYLMDGKAGFPNWRCDARNILTLFFCHSGVSPGSGGDAYSGAWAYPESSSCCGRSLWYSPMIHAPAFAQYAVETGDAWMRELAYRQMVLQTYDVQETGVSEDNIDGGAIVNGAWLNIAHPLPLRFVLAGIGWLPEELGASRENHIVRSTAVVNAVNYGDGRIEYTTFDAPENTAEVLRLSFVPETVTADGTRLERRPDAGANGYAVKPLPNGDAIVTVRHDGARRVVLTGDDPQRVLEGAALARQGAEVSVPFDGNQVRVIGSVGPDGGLADVLLDGQRQRVHVDCWNPVPRGGQVLYYRNGLTNGPHTLGIMPRGARNPRSGGVRVDVESVQFSAEDRPFGYPSGTGPVETQRMVFGYAGGHDIWDSEGRRWRPATEMIIRTGHGTDAVTDSWWSNPATNAIARTADPELYRYGVHGREFWVNLTVGPGTYHLRLKFAAARGQDTRLNCFDIRINGRRVAKRLDVAATAGGHDRAVDLMFNDVAPRNGLIEVRFEGARVEDAGRLVQGEAFVQALELGPGAGRGGAQPVSSSAPEPESAGNLLVNPGFEESEGGAAMAGGARRVQAGWTYEFAGPMTSYVWQEADFIRHPPWGLPECHGGAGAIRTHSDGGGHTMISQDVEVEPRTDYEASVWVRAADLRGKGFGQDPGDSARLVVWELDEAGKVVRRHARAEVRKPGPYRQLCTRLTTGASTSRVRIILDTVIGCPYQEGHVTYDDCSLAKAAVRRARASSQQEKP